MIASIGCGCDDNPQDAAFVAWAAGYLVSNGVPTIWDSLEGEAKTDGLITRDWSKFSTPRLEALQFILSTDVASKVLARPSPPPPSSMPTLPPPPDPPSPPSAEPSPPPSPLPPPPAPPAWCGEGRPLRAAGAWVCCSPECPTCQSEASPLVDAPKGALCSASAIQERGVHCMQFSSSGCVLLDWQHVGPSPPPPPPPRPPPRPPPSRPPRPPPRPPPPRHPSLLGHADVSTQSLPAALAGVLALSALLLIVSRTWRRRSAWAPVDASEDPDEHGMGDDQGESCRTMAVEDHASSEHFLPATRRPPWLPGTEEEDEEEEAVVDRTPGDDEIVIL